MKEKLNPLVKEYRRINKKPKQFQKFKYFVYYKLLRNTKNKFQRNLSKFPEKQEVRTKLGALAIFQRGCALNNQGQKLFQFGVRTKLGYLR